MEMKLSEFKDRISKIENFNDLNKETRFKYYDEIFSSIGDDEVVAIHIDMPEDLAYANYLARDLLQYFAFSRKIFYQFIDETRLDNLDNIDAYRDLFPLCLMEVSKYNLKNRKRETKILTSDFIFDLCKNYRSAYEMYKVYHLIDKFKNLDFDRIEIYLNEPISSIAVTNFVATSLYTFTPLKFIINYSEDKFDENFYFIASDWGTIVDPCRIFGFYNSSLRK